MLAFYLDDAEPSTPPNGAPPRDDALGALPAPPPARAPRWLEAWRAHGESAEHDTAMVVGVTRAGSALRGAALDAACEALFGWCLDAGGFEFLHVALGAAVQMQSREKEGLARLVEAVECVAWAQTRAPSRAGAGRPVAPLAGAAADSAALPDDDALGGSHAAGHGTAAPASAPSEPAAASDRSALGARMRERSAALMEVRELHASATRPRVQAALERLQALLARPDADESPAESGPQSPAESGPQPSAAAAPDGAPPRAGPSPPARGAEAARGAARPVGVAEDLLEVRELYDSATRPRVLRALEQLQLALGAPSAPAADAGAPAVPTAAAAAAAELSPAAGAPGRAAGGMADALLEARALHGGATRPRVQHALERLQATLAREGVAPDAEAATAAPAAAPGAGAQAGGAAEGGAKTSSTAPPGEDEARRRVQQLMRSAGLDADSAADPSDADPGAPPDSERLEAVVAEMTKLRDHGGALDPAERRARAERTALELAKLIGLDGEGSDDEEAEAGAQNGSAAAGSGR